MKILVGILSCNKNTELQAAVRRTWYRNNFSITKKSISYTFNSYFICAGKSLEVRGDTVYVPCTDDYEGHISKILGFYKWALSQDFDYLYKADDDTYCRLERFPELPFTDYTGCVVAQDGLDRSYHKGKVKSFKPYTGPYLGSYACGGGGYLLSRKSVEIVANSNRDYSQEVWEDKFVGDILRINGIICKDCYQISDKSSVGDSYISKHRICIHPLTVQQMDDTHRLIEG